MNKKIELTKKHCKKILEKYDYESGYEFVPPQLNWAICAMIEYAEEERERCDKSKEYYETIFSEFIPVDKLDEANNKLIELFEGDTERIGRALFK